MTSHQMWPIGLPSDLYMAMTLSWLTFCLACWLRAADLIGESSDIPVLS